MSSVERIAVAIAAVWISACASGSIGDPLGVDAGRDTDANSRNDAAPMPDAIPLADATPPDAAPCIEGTNQTVGADGTCFTYFSTSATWAAARLICQQNGADIAISTSPQDDAIYVLLAPGVADVWLAGTDMAVEMTWLWITGDMWGPYTNWRAGEPNNSGSGGEDCMVIEVDNAGTWDDRSCGNSYPHFCRR